MALTMEFLVHEMVERGASDIHLVIGAPPQLRIDGIMTPIEGTERLMPDACQQLIYSVLTDEQKRRFEEEQELDISFGVKDVGRIRMNVFRQRGTIGAALRGIPNEIPGFEQLGLPPIVKKIADIPVGLVLVTGPTGTGKSTTLASMIDYINTSKKLHLITVEDPIEFLHRHKSCIVVQREVGSDTKSFAQALKHMLRQDPDVILVGEMRDLETISAALTIAETGHLVFATLHTPDAIQSVNRIIDVYPAHQQQQVRAQLSFVLKATVSQTLIPHASGRGRVVACEILISTPAIANLIRDGKIHQAYTIMQAGKQFGMQTMNSALTELYRRGMITYENAMIHSQDPESLKKMLTGGVTYEARVGGYGVV
ncbi:TPA: type IV pili twitching motility protein PilT [bacterium]|nr:type IV pili twitching motility protein PilT [bacterium]